MIASPFHHIDVLNRDGATVAEETDEDGKTDGRLGRGEGWVVPGLGLSGE